MKRLVALSLILAACGDNLTDVPLDARVDAPRIDALVDAPIDTPDIDAPIDTPVTPSGLAGVRSAADGVVDIDVVNATVTYLKPAVTGASLTNDPIGFTVQTDATGPGLFVAVDPAVLTLTPALAVGDVISFTVTMKSTAGMSPRATAISDVTRSMTATSVNALVQNATALTDLVTAIGNYDGELVDITAATIASAFAASGTGYERANITTAGITALDTNFQLRMPAAFRATLDLELGCIVAVNNAPVGRFNAQAQIGVWTTADITVTSCPAPAVTSAIATSATTVQVNFSRNLDVATLLAAGTQFTVDNGLTVSAAALTGPRQITLTTSAQTSGTTYVVTAANTLKDTVGGSLATTLTATFAGYTVPVPSVMVAVADTATSVKVTFTRAIDAATVLANGSQFTVDNGLTVSAATTNGLVVTLTTSAQTPGTVYTVTVANTVKDTAGTALGAPLTAMFMGFTAPVAANHLVINEIDYDNDNTDIAEFIEILNPTAASISLVGKRIVLVNGGNVAAPALYGSPNTSVYDLSSVGTLAAGEYLVLAPTALTVPSTAKRLALAGAMDQIQNGTSDAVFLVDIGDLATSILPTIVDSITYEGNTTGNLSYDAAGQTLVLVPEGTSSTTGVDVNAGGGSVCRSPNGADSNNNATDIKFCTTSTPGAANSL